MHAICVTSYEEDVPFETLAGKTLRSIERSPGGYDDELIFATSDGQRYRMHHIQDCCERVDIESIDGDLADLLGSPLVQAEAVSGGGEPQGEYDESYTWTFYKLATNKGSVTIRWYGTSNGYYSESVDFTKIKEVDFTKIKDAP